MFFSQPIRFPDHFLRITAHLDNPDGITFRRRSRFQLIIKRQGIVGKTSSIVGSYGRKEKMR